MELDFSEGQRANYSGAGITSADKPGFCYVLMPFGESLSQTYRSAIKSAVSEASSKIGRSLRCVRGDEIAGPGSITREIVCSIYTADVVIADLTGNNPNVFYELGIAHSIGNKTIMITQSVTDVPFDVGAYRLISYKSSSAGLAALRDELAEAIVEVFRRRCGPSNPVQDFAPIPYTRLMVPFPDLVVHEGQVSGEVWLMPPSLEVDLKFFRDVIKHNIVNRSIHYRYLVPNTPSVLRTLGRLREALGVTEEAWQRVSVRVVAQHMVESEVVIYDAYTDREQVFLMSPLEDANPFWFPVRGSRALVIRDRYEHLWNEVAKPLVVK